MSSSSSSSSLVPSNASGVVLDALPYIDAVHEDYEAYALALVEQEMTKISPISLPPLAPSLQSSSGSNRSAILQTEVDLVSQADGGKRQAAIDLESWDIAIPQTNEVKEWKEAIQKARAAYEAERQRQTVLQLESKHAPEQWKYYTSTILEPFEQQESALHSHQQSILDEIHAQRQAEQVEASKTLAQLQNKYRDLIHKRHSLQRATLDLQAEVNRMKRTLSDGIPSS